MRTGKNETTERSKTVPMTSEVPGNTKPGVNCDFGEIILANVFCQQKRVGICEGPKTHLKMGASREHAMNTLGPELWGLWCLTTWPWVLNSEYPTLCHQECYSPSLFICREVYACFKGIHSTWKNQLKKFKLGVVVH